MTKKYLIAALAIAAAGQATLGASTIKSIQDLANDITTSRGGPNLDDLAIGTVSGGDSVSGDIANSTNDMNGASIVSSTFSGWNGNDDVYSLQWGGGDITIDLFFTMSPGNTTNDGDLDLFLVADINGGAFLDSSLTTTDNEQIVSAALAAGKYWIVIDGWDEASNGYKLAVSPTPGAAAVFGLAGLAAAGRRRR